MFSKFTLCLVLTLATCYGQEGWHPVEEDYLESREEEPPCDSAVCVAPCPGAAPPPYCPPNMTQCSSGCACMLECHAPETVCFMTKFCTSRRRYLTRSTTPLQLGIRYMQ